MNTLNLYDKYFDVRYKAIFELCSKIAEKSDCKIYLVGGIVRDLLLNIKSRAIDITVVGNVCNFAKNLLLTGKAKILSEHKEFGGVKIEIQGKKIDFTQTRSERYPKKGHLPVTKLGCTLKEDVLRRDFTVNALALSLNSENFGELIDFVGGYEDLKSKKLKILHSKSFIDDPTRIVRGLKYSLRLGFDLDYDTKKLQDEYLAQINYDMGYNRIKNELKLTFELNKNEILEKFITQGIYKLITQKKPPKITIDIERATKKYASKNIWLIYFGLFVIAEDENFLEKYELTKVEKRIIKGAKRLVQEEISDDKFEIYKAFCAFPSETLILTSNFKHKEKIAVFLDELSGIKLEIPGEDLVKMGYVPSEKFKNAFEYILREKIYNPTITKQHEKTLIQQ